jgi:hypothetical protein
MDDAIEASFPASDPPPTSPMTTGAPKRSRPAQGPKKHAESAQKRRA